MILGHEVVGEIVEIGPTAARRWGVAAGDRIVVEEDIPCGRCHLCRTGRYRMCNGLRVPGEGKKYGVTPVAEPPHLWGGYAEYMYLHPNSVVYKIPPTLSSVTATAFLPIANGIEWVRRYGELLPGGTVVIQGPGQQGLGCVIGAREAGAGKIIVTGTARDTNRLDLAQRLGADRTIRVDEEDPVEVVRDFTENAMADLVIDATAGAPGVPGQSLDLAALNGTIVLAATHGGSGVPGFVTDKMIWKELTVRGACGHDCVSVSAALEVLKAKRYPVEGFCTHTFPIEESEEAILTVGGQRDGDAIHVVVVSDGAGS